MFCWSLFVLLYFFFWSLCCLCDFKEVDVRGTHYKICDWQGFLCGKKSLKIPKGQWDYVYRRTDNAYSVGSRTKVYSVGSRTKLYSVGSRTKLYCVGSRTKLIYRKGSKRQIDIMYDLIISLTGEVCTYKTSLIRPLILSAYINAGKCAIMYMCVRGINVNLVRSFMMVMIPRLTAVARTTFGHLLYHTLDVKVMFNLF
jgi:hypothetical protein